MAIRLGTAGGRWAHPNNKGLQAFWRCKPSNVGAGNRNRTYDLRITNAPLYRLSYSGDVAADGRQDGEF